MDSDTLAPAAGEGHSPSRIRNRVDWPSVKTEYITTNTSYQRLADKYGVSNASVSRRARLENWAALRLDYARRTEERILEAVSTLQAARAERLQKAADRLLDRVEQLLDSPVAAELPPQSLRHISGVLKDIRDVQMIKSSLDCQEQALKIANLRRQGQPEQRAVTVTLEGAVKDYAR